MHYEAESPFAEVRGSGVDGASFQTWLCGPAPHYHHLRTCRHLTACLVCGSHRPCSSTEDEEEVLLELTSIRKTEKESTTQSLV